MRWSGIALILAGNTPAPLPEHQQTAFELCRLLDDYLALHPIGHAMLSPSDLELCAGTITQPDVFVVPAETISAAGEHGLRWPDVRSLLLAIEVRSRSSLRSDRVLKRDLYLENGVQEYWIADFDARAIECWMPGANTPSVHSDRIVWSPKNGPALEHNVRDVFYRVDRKLGRPRM